MKQHHKVAIKYLLFCLVCIICGLACSYLFPSAVSIILLAEVGMIILFYGVFSNSFHITRSKERNKELELYLIMHVRDIVRGTRVPSNAPGTRKQLSPKVEWDENKITFHANSDTGTIRISEKWLYAKANEKQRFFLMRWCKHFLYYASQGHSSAESTMYADRDALEDCISQKYDSKNLLAFIFEAFSYPYRLSIARIDQIKNILSISK